MQRFYRFYQIIRVGEMLVQKIDNHIPAQAVVRGIHGKLAEKVTHIRFYYGDGSQSIPQVVQGKKSLGTHAAALILQRYERAAQFHCIGGIFLHELVREAEHVAGGQQRLAIGTHLPILT